ncbi:MAG: hypothetical protein A3B23_03370 [Candidatus Colwellbacteria bacterium RIFCSPLOWO2_01_FULL_48_10]|uniref:Polyketide synthase-like methyltransferase domain-containing protein n=2 Tax=Bacteria candidate phyla TaxID=1783234 RepID=A0A1F5NYH4_9BACT|nr:MAG: hypothetical protein A2846_01595 [Candidatus Doudnabacteria bacterium RIFCSPHIGHO2_01_FULL_49_9]OGY59683.1 MAG: hypothetical protein A3B23_03370 [Candidatus Colwellbacteria bacterium RIFCSPLOWO2_01_FULL_48_10]
MNRPDRSEVAKYYDETLLFYKYIWYKAGGSNGIHYGFWDKDTQNIEAALLNQNKFMAELAKIDPSSRVLDAGCGVGGSVVWLAKNIGVKVMGITISRKQLKEAGKVVLRSGVGDKVEFFLRDYRETGFPDGSFDVVWASESVCYAEDKKDFIKEAFRLLKPGGRLVVADGFLSRLPDGLQQKNYCDLLGGWALPNLAIKDAFETDVKECGFKNVRFIDKTEAVRNSSERIKKLFSKYALCVRIAEILGIFRQATKTKLAASGQYELMRRGIMIYGVFYAEK